MLWNLENYYKVRKKTTACCLLLRLRAASDPCCFCFLTRLCWYSCFVQFGTGASVHKLSVTLLSPMVMPSLAWVAWHTWSQTVESYVSLWGFHLWKREGLALVGWTASTTEGRGPCVQKLSSCPSMWSCASSSPLETVATGFWPARLWGHIGLLMWRKGQEHTLNPCHGKGGSMEVSGQRIHAMDLLSLVSVTFCGSTVKP